MQISTQMMLCWSMQSRYLIFLIINQLDAPISQIYFGMKIYIFRTVPLSIMGFSLYTQQWYKSYRFADSLRAGSGWNRCSVLILFASCLQNCITYSIAVCTVKNSRWWTPLSITRSFALYTQQWYMSYRFARTYPPARKLSSKLYDMYHCCVYSEKLLMMDRGTVQNM
jgi:hypothetical protein